MEKASNCNLQLWTSVKAINFWLGREMIIPEKNELDNWITLVMCTIRMPCYLSSPYPIWKQKEKPLDIINLNTGNCIINVHRLLQR